MRLKLAAAAAAGLAGGCAYAALSAGSQFFGSTLIAGRNPDEVVLTFDDGPNDPYTMQLLEVLDRHRIKATFFMIGRFVRRRPDIVRQVRAAGHVVCNHTMTHPWLVLASLSRVRQELADCNATLEDVLGEEIKYFRPPHGARRPDVLCIAAELGLTPVMWNVIGYDWRPGIDPATIRGHLVKGIRRNRRMGRGSNIVLHDGGHTGIGQDRSATVKAVDALSSQLFAAALTSQSFANRQYGGLTVTMITDG